MPISSKYHTDKPWVFFGLAVAFLLSINVLDFFTKASGQSILREFGPIELSSALLYGYATSIWLWTRPGEEWKTSWQIPALMLMMMGRELDLDKKLTSVGLLKSQLYFTNSAPLLERLLGVIVVAFVALMVLRLLLINGPALLSGLKSFSFWAWCVVASAAFGVISKSIDGIARKLSPFGIVVEPTVEAKFIYVEELLETGIPLLFLAATIASLSSRKALHRDVGGRR